MDSSGQKITEKGKWTEECLRAALEMVKKGHSVKSSAQKFKIPRTTLRDRMKTNNFNKPLLGRKAVFTEKLEKDLVKHVLFRGGPNGVTMTKLRLLAFEFAEIIKVKHMFNKSKKMAGEDWAIAFRKRHPEVVLRKSEATATSDTEAELFSQILKNAEESNFDNSSNPTDDEPVGEYVLPTVPKDVQATTSTKNESFLDSPSTSFSPSFDQPVPVKNSSILPTKTIIHSNALVPTTSLLTRKRPVQIPKSFNTETDPSDETTKKLKCINDEFTHFGNNVASQLRNMSLEKALLCQNEIMMVLMKYRVESLQSTTTSPSSPPQSQLNPIPISNIKVEVTDF